jgi:hypothetical protein
MTSFEHYFKALKRALGRDDLYDLWPNFEPQYNEKEYMWTNLTRIGEVLLLNCGQCDGPSDSRHNQCKSCIAIRKKRAVDAYQKATSKENNWKTIILCRIPSS